MLSAMAASIGACGTCTSPATCVSSASTWYSRMPGAAIPILSSIGALATASEAWIVDIWGVMHNGARAFDAAGEACRKFRAGGGIVILLSNAPRPFSAIGYPVAPAIFVLACLLIVGNAIYSRPGPTTAGLLVIGAGIPLYMWLTRRRTVS